MDKSALISIARFTLKEAVNNRLFGLTLAGLLIMFGLTEFAGELAITESIEVRALLAGSSVRLFIVFTVSLFVITSMIREFNDKGFELILSLPIPRHSYFLGKMIGYMVLGALFILAGGLLLLVYSQASWVMFWMLSLGCELTIMIALSLLCLLTFSNVTVAFVTVMAFYFLARSMHVIQLVSRSPILEYHTVSQEFMNFLVNALAFVMPELDRFTVSDWLLHGVSGPELVLVVVQTAIYVPLLVAAGLFDLYRKEL